MYLQETFDHHKRSRGTILSRMMASLQLRMNLYIFDQMRQCSQEGYSSNYILPESIASFGRICKDSYAVVNLPSFWIRLYRDFAYDDQKFPVDTKGLKSKVIRHLFKEYFPFSSRITSARAKVYDPHVLVGLTCISHQWNLCDCEAAYANRRVRIRIAFGKSKSKSLWETSQVRNTNSNLHFPTF